jgi:NADH dehydrogenase
VVWTAGVRAGELGAGLGVELARQGRVPVTETLQLAGRPEVFAIGDAAARGDLPMLIPVAMQQARHVARAIRALESGRPAGAFEFHDPGIMATVGRNAAVAQLGPVRLSGFPGWVLWLTVHLMNVVTFRARAVVLFNWAWEYVFYDRPIRLRLQAGSGPRELAAVEE